MNFYECCDLTKNVYLRRLAVSLNYSTYCLILADYLCTELGSSPLVLYTLDKKHFKNFSGHGCCRIDLLLCVFVLRSTKSFNRTLFLNTYLGFLQSSFTYTLKPWYREQVRQNLFVNYIEWFTISNIICLVNPQNGSWVLFTILQNSLYWGSLYQGLSVLV